MRKRISSYKKAFTLIEIMIGTIIIGVIVAIGIASYNNFNEQKKIQGAAEELKNYLRLASAKASYGEKDCTVCSYDGVCPNSEDLPLEGWFINFSTNPPTLYGECGDNFFPDPKEQLNGLLDIKFTFNPSLPDPDQDKVIQFKPSGNGTNLTELVTITVGSETSSVNAFLNVDPSGNVSDF